MKKMIMYLLYLNLIDLIPETKIEETVKLPGEEKCCIICLEDYEILESVLKLSCTLFSFKLHQGLVKSA